MNLGKGRTWVLCGAALLALGACQGSRQRVEPITVEEIAAHIRYLSDDLLGGRAVGTKGIEMAARYHEDYFRTMGLEPAFGTSYSQSFPLKGSKPDPQATLEVVGGPAVAMAPVLGEEFIVRTEREDVPAEPSGELVYCGYLVQAPERSWDDVKGMDIAGKVLLVEVNEPGNRPYSPARPRRSPDSSHHGSLIGCEKPGRVAPAAYPADLPVPAGRRRRLIVPAASGA